mmetsp:Transcript_8999/g.15659  ORF Transcript_8999/g.15659 Transcript_8999/m.15659 type:complete len:322 (-) Transcript_8999:50-1015(-)
MIWPSKSMTPDNVLSESEQSSRPSSHPSATEPLQRAPNQNIPSSPSTSFHNVDRETLATAVAEPMVSIDCSSTLTTAERSIFIKRGMCSTCGIQTHKISGLLKKRCHPLTNENVLSGRCIICNPINIVTHQTVEEHVNVRSLNDAGETHFETQGESLHGVGCCERMTVNTDAHVSGVEDEAKKNGMTHIIDYSNPSTHVLSSDLSLRSFAQDTNPPSHPSAPPFESSNHTEGLAGGDSTPNPQDKWQRYFSKSESYNEVKQWLLSHLPTLQKQDLEKYRDCLMEDGFDSNVMLEVVEERDLNFMKKAHRRFLLKQLQSGLS